MVPFRPEEKPSPERQNGLARGHSGRLGPLGPPVRQRTGEMVSQLHQRRLVAVFGDIEALQGRLWLKALRQGIRSAPQVVWLRDGARGLWCLFEECFTAYAMGILDFYHAAQRALEGSNRLAGWTHEQCASVVQLGTAPPTAWQAGWGSWQTWRMPWTWRGCLRQHGDTVRTVYAYLQRHREHIDYAKYKELGLPLGSGMVESACKWLISNASKGSGCGGVRTVSTISCTSGLPGSTDTGRPCSTWPCPRTRNYAHLKIKRIIKSFR